MANNTFIVEVPKEDYNALKRLENKTGGELYNELGLKRSDVFCLSFKINSQFTLHVSQEIPHHEDEYTYSSATLEDTLNNRYYDNDGFGDTILGEWFFILDNKDEISIILKEEV